LLSKHARKLRQVLWCGIGNDVQILGCTDEPMYADRDSTDDDELDLCVRQREQQFIGREHH
jgi:hypothetical protein